MLGRILIVEDDEKLARMVELELTHEGYETEKAFDGASGLEAAEGGGFDLILLDVMLPKMSGVEVLRRIRKTSDVPVILLTARDEVVDKVSGLDSGADDYVTKPFVIEELLARIRAAMRKRAAMSESDDDGHLLRAEDSGRVVTLDTLGYTVTVAVPDEGESQVELTHKEFELLACLLENKGRVMGRESLLNQVWGYDYIGETNVVDVYVRFLRSKIDEPYGLHLITTVRGAGYKIS